MSRCFVTVTMGFASVESHTAITVSPMLRISKRLTANIFHEPEGEAGTSAAAAARADAARLLTAAKSHRPLSRPHQRLQRRAPAMTAAAESNSERPKGSSRRPRARTREHRISRRQVGTVPDVTCLLLCHAGIRLRVPPDRTGQCRSIPGYWRRIIDDWFTCQAGGLLQEPL